MDNQGNELLKTTYFDTTVDYHADPYNSMVINKNELITCLIMDNVSQYEVKSKVISVDKHTLDTLWTKTYPHPDTASIMSSADKYSTLTAIKATPDNSYILTGNYMTAGNERSYLMKIDSVGNILWTKTYNSYYTFFSLQIAPDSGFYIPCTYNGYMLKILKVDKNGNYKWDENINSNPNPTYPLAVALQQNGNIAVTSSFWYDLTNNLRGITVSSINPITKSLVWEKNYILYENLAGITLHQAMGLEILPDGSFIVSGTVQKDGGRKGFIFKLNSNGDSLWTKTYDFGTHYNNNDRCQLNDLISTDDGGFFGVGFFWDKTSNDVAWMFKTDANSIVGFENSKFESSMFNAYPNPATDFVKIEFNSQKSNILNYKIYNSQGKMVLSEIVLTNDFTVNIKDFASGVYFIEATTSSGERVVEKFVKE
jgi:hypothetical protein